MALPSRSLLCTEGEKHTIIIYYDKCYEGEKTTNTKCCDSTKANLTKFRGWGVKGRFPRMLD